MSFMFLYTPLVLIIHVELFIFFRKSSGTPSFLFRSRSLSRPEQPQPAYHQQFSVHLASAKPSGATPSGVSPGILGPFGEYSAVRSTPSSRIANNSKNSQQPRLFPDKTEKCAMMNTTRKRSQHAPEIICQVNKRKYRRQE